MGHAHDHGPGPASKGVDRARTRRALTAVLVLTATFTVTEVVGGLLTGSLALLADAGHMLSDDFSLGLALFAVWLAQRPSTPTRSFGFKRAEILAALVNGAALVAISVWIFIAAYGRLSNPPEILGGWMLAVAALGLSVNITGAAILWRARSESLNLKAAFRHVLADLVGSVGVIIAAVVILLTEWVYADALVSVLIGLLILASSWTILRDSVRILLEGTPEGIDSEEVCRAMATMEGVVEVHDLHIWTITSGFPALAAHVLVGPNEDCHRHRRELELCLLERFGIDHTTLQVDHAGAERLIPAEELLPPE